MKAFIFYFMIVLMDTLYSSVFSKDFSIVGRILCMLKCSMMKILLFLSVSNSLRGADVTM